MHSILLATGLISPEYSLYYAAIVTRRLLSLEEAELKQVYPVPY
ncbi:hypothetical protein [Salmonella phage SP154]|nr:hypothetical protein [Salmonella phage SP154]